ncbi:hypothetical protein ACHAWO_007590 [Cyclotella atomus]|uniref:FAM13A-like domain-containing protein n=1 Tax=Cyclotella atomus TaxID=382360 RepID=A0ABD3MPQ9_9STRA
MIKTNSPGGNTSSSLSRPLRRRRQSKGLIAESRDASSSNPSSTLPSPPPASSSSDPPLDEPTAKPCHYAKIIAACIDNALEMGAITKYSLCPNKARKSLLLRVKASRHRSNNNNRSSDGSTDIMDEFIAHPTEIEEEYSSADEDDYIDFSANTTHNSAAAASQLKKEPYYIPTLPESASMAIQGQCKLPFNYRKCHYFDAVTADDRAVARKFLREELYNLKRIRVKALSNRLKRAASSSEAVKDQQQEEEESLQQQEEEMLSTLLTRFPHKMTHVYSAALLLESLTLNTHESMEGLSKCYDGIVSAGLALLDSNPNNSNTSQKTNNTSSLEIMSALEPLLISTLPKSSGETFLKFLTLRKYAGSARYQRRYIQRLAPYLVRPPDSAIWCLRHQNDIEAIVACVELILDKAEMVFSNGWVERGRGLMKDSSVRSKAGENTALRSATNMLRSRLNCSPVEGLLSVGGSLHYHNRRGSLGGGRRESVGGQESLAEWEVMSIDRHVRQSVLDVFSKDWSRISALNLSPTESDTMSYGRRRSSFGGAKAKSADWQHNNDAATSTLTKSPRSKIPLSPRNGPSQIGGGHVPSADALESTFGPSFSSQDIDDNFSERPLSPPNNYSSAAPLSPTRLTDSNRLTHPKTPPHESHNLEHPSSPGATYRSGLAPLSPQSSVGNNSAASSGVLSARSVSAPAGSRDQYRALTSTAAERKRTVAACRALRAQITKFEESFIQLHGRAPKGTAERAPLASTYMQYREWKRAIRADAACRIQALCRGALVRSMMLRSSDPRVSRIVASRRARTQRIERRTSDHLSHLSIPLDIGGSDQNESFDHGANRGMDSKSRLEARTSSRDDDDGVEVVMRPNAMSPAASPGWKRQQAMNQSAHSSPGSHSTRPSGKSHSILPDVTQMSLPELQQRKRELKQQLKMYDLNFHAQHGRMPEKREKEPIRHLYESYNAYKNQITVIEKGEAQPGPGTAAFRGRDVVVPAPVNDPAPERISPTNQSSASNSPGNEGTESPKNAHDFVINSSNDASKNSSDDVIPQDLASLKAEKATLHQMLRSYEKDFFKQHQRQVSSFSDIRPVAGQYRRYKEIKKSIAQLQDR